MAVPHCFVLAKLNPTKSMSWVASSTGHAVANKFINPRPIVAIRMRNRHAESSGQYDSILIVSSEKPPKDFPGYVPIFPHTDGPRSPIRITPSLPQDGPTLYIHTGHRLRLHPHSHYLEELQTTFVIDAADSSRLYDYAIEDYLHLRKRGRKIAKAGSGGNDLVGSEWSSFSAPEATDSGLNRPFAFCFDLSPLSTLPMDATGPLTIYNELNLLHRVSDDYSWVGVSDTIKYIAELNPDPDPLSQFPTPSIQHSFKCTPHAIALSAMTVPVNGEQLQLDPQVDLETWGDDEWQPSFSSPPGKLPTALSKELRVLWFDVHGTISDRETIIKGALQPILERDPVLRTKDEGLSLYLECEARSFQNSTSSERMLAGIRLFGDTIGVDTEDQQHAFVSKVTGFKTWPDVSRALSAFRQKGFRLVASSNFGTAILASNLEVPFDHVFGNECAFHEVLPDSLFKQVLGYCREEYAAGASQILLVTSNAYRGVEPASASGIPTAHLRRPGYLEGCENATELVLTKPSYVASNLLELCHKLGLET